jgi:2-O-methyltransferase
MWPLLRRPFQRSPRSRRRDPGTIDLRELHGLLGNDVQVILEVGANDGADTLRLLAEFPDAVVHCFEPDPRARVEFGKRVTSERACLYPYAIGAHDGVTRFFESSGAPPGREDEYPDGWHLSGSIRSPRAHLEAHPWCRFDSTIDVSVRTLDTWCAAAGVQSVDFIWADVQGAEADLILGGGSALVRTRYLYTEYNNDELYEGQPNLDRILHLLPGWAVRHLYEDDVLLENRSLSPARGRR